MYKQSKNEEFYMGDEALVFYTDEMLEIYISIARSMFKYTTRLV
jgi:hypothetical protein